LRAIALIKNNIKDNNMQVNKITEITPPNNKVLTGLKYSLAFSLALSWNIALSTNVTIDTARVLP